LLYFLLISSSENAIKYVEKSIKVRQAEITFGKVISAEKTGRLFYFSPFSGYVYKEK